ncbi:transposase, partial [Lachnospiraceae bacterium 64-25]
TFRQGKILPKSETAKGLAYSINQEEYLKVFLADGEVPIDNSASERALRNFTIGLSPFLSLYKHPLFLAFV